MWDDAQDEELQASYRQELAFEFPGCAHALGCHGLGSILLRVRVLGFWAFAF